MVMSQQNKTRTLQHLRGLETTPWEENKWIFIDEAVLTVVSVVNVHGNSTDDKVEE